MIVYEFVSLNILFTTLSLIQWSFSFHVFWDLLASTSESNSFMVI